ncbi:AbrB family transcriptional regulator [Paenibacillus oleatilyticus]|uniref:AbrB family transcriptional regulator n=1 Tax=Paenibacillus oleatilyticus TaxID=2594886 RepID=UPI001C1F915C|nr:AbrB family transcriptional regulator [Paenibacillus oleatilyticus]MBU7317741.1 AbrB family transcriptional regulator [Paenibacillus oleatilyticus]
MAKRDGVNPIDWARIDDREQDGKIVIREADKVSPSEGISADFIDTLSQAMKEYGETLKGLKDR